ncbi:hypothetical protein QL285_001883 [Trifolium repens]|nr:hypothetical protein QL285_001883 [Trifolium repens]
MGGGVKRRRIKQLIHSESVDFMAIQETKLEVIPDTLCYSLWGGQDCDWAFLPAEGNSGGILSIWRKVDSSLIFTFIGEGFVGVCLEWGVRKQICFVVNVYAKCDLNAKRRLWENIIMSKGGFGGGLWCVVGDFNAVTSSNERRGIGVMSPSLHSTEVREFNRFIATMEVEDLHPVGGNFTWFHPNGVSMSRIDRALVSEEWLSSWGLQTLRILPRDVSDHCPLLLKGCVIVSRPKPFRFCNHWLLHKDFVGMVEDFWRSLNVEGWMGYVLKEKLKFLKVMIKDWNKAEYGKMEEKIRNLVSSIREKDLRGEQGLLISSEIEERKKLFGDLWRLLKSKDVLLAQRSRAKWLKEGDTNSKYFHGCLKSRERRNSISCLKVRGRWIDNSTEIFEEVTNFFNLHFSSSPWPRPKLNGVMFPSVSEEDNGMLMAPFRLEEIEDVVSSCDGNKSPGPDGFNFAFVKTFWSMLKGEVRILFDQFHGNACLPQGLVSYFITLIPKVARPSSLGEFRPISLLGCLYKLIAKVLAARLAKVMDSLVATTQSAFIKGRNLVDGVMVINEVIDLAKKLGRPCLIFKVDFEKAYDSVDWGFLEYMLRRFGFGGKWIDWIKACVFSGNLSVLVNGSPTSEINIQRGLKQGDPLAPFLFLLVAEGFAGLMRSAVEKSLFKGFHVGSGSVVVSHLQYADDTICVGEASLENLWTLKAILRGFELASGLKVNFWKSSLMGVNVPPSFLEMACGFLNCKRGVIPFSYLGLPVGANPRRCATWEPLLDQLRKRLLSWGNRYVSLGGRIVILNSVLNAIPIFYLSFMKLPAMVLKKIVRIQREFLWGGLKGGRRICWVSWKEICKPRNQGGLGVREVGKVNLSLLIKWRWRLLNRDNVLWKDVLVAKYGRHIRQKVHWVGFDIGLGTSAWWKDLCTIDIRDGGSWFAQNLRRKVGNGLSTRFWFDCWMGSPPLCERFPRLFSISNNKEGLVDDYWREKERWFRGEWGWRRRLFVWEEALLVDLFNSFPALTLSDGEDEWVWLLGGDGMFSVKSTYDYLGIIFSPEPYFGEEDLRVLKNIWKSPAPSKVIAFSWKLLRNRIPTRANLVLRGVDVNGGLVDCVHCHGAEESALHLFLYCDFAMVVWKAIFRWLGVVIIIPHNLFSLFDCFVAAAGPKKVRKGFALIWHATVWSLWNSRNNVIFDNGVTDPEKVVDDIKLLSWKWGLSRHKIPICLYYEWCWDPGLCLRN